MPEGGDSVSEVIKVAIKTICEILNISSGIVVGYTMCRFIAKKAEKKEGEKDA